MRAVATANDFPIIEDKIIDFAELMGNARMMAENVLAHDKVLYIGHAVAAVAATSPHIAEEALKLIKVEYDVLPAALTVYDAMKEDAPLLHEDMTTRFRVERFARGEDTGENSNVAGHLQFASGDLQQRFKEADVIVEQEFSTQTVHQGYIEPHVSTASWATDGHLSIWTSTQGTFAIRTLTVAILGIPRVCGESHPYGDWGWVWSQAYRLPGPRSRHPLQKERAASQNSDESHGGVRGNGPYVWHSHAVQNRSR